MQISQSLEQALPAARQPYSAPQLTTYGLVRELTAGGSAGTGETHVPLPGPNKSRKS